MARTPEDVALSTIALGAVVAVGVATLLVLYAMQMGAHVFPLSSIAQGIEHLF